MAKDRLSEPDNAFKPDPVAAIFRQSMLWVPERQVVSAWNEHVPFAFWVVDVLAPRTIVELGTHCGVSYSAMCQAVKALDLPTRCFAVDTWKGDEHSGHYGEEVFRDFAEFHDSRYGAFSRLVRSSFDEAVGHFDDGSIDLLHLDGLHEYEAVRHDFMTWLPKLSPHAVMLLHDTNVHERGFGVSRVWAEVSAGRPHFNFLHGHGLGVLGLGHDNPEPLKYFLAASNSEVLTTAIRRAFASLGRSALLATSLVESNVLHARIELDRARTDVAVVRLRAEVLQAKAQAGQAHVQRSRIQSELNEVRTQSEEARARCVRLESQLTSLQHQLGVLQPRAAEAALLKSDLQRATAEAEAARRESSRLQGKVKVMAGSTTWRIAAAIRSVAAALPQPLYVALRRGAKLAWWLVTPRAIPRRIEFLRSAQLIRSHGFNTDWYLANYPDIAAAGIDPVKHYLSSGAAEGRDPGPHFSTGGYLWRYPDVAAAGTNPLVHYIRLGMREGRNPHRPSDAELLSRSEFFDRDWYLRTYEAVAAAGLDPIVHYLATGAAQGHDPGPRFSTRGYLIRYPDAAASGVNALVHYIQVGVGEARNPGPPTEAELVSVSEFFDRDWYLAKCLDAAAARADPANHYLEVGAAEGCDPGPSFSTRAYLSRYPDVAAANVNPLLHYIQAGSAEGRNPGPQTEAELLSTSELFDGSWYLRTYPDVAAAGVDPAEHYVMYGAAEARDPGPNFSTKGYLIRNTDVAAAGVNPLHHFIQHGAAEGRSADPPTVVELLSASEFFDRGWYLKTYPDVAAIGVDPVWHYVENGSAELRDPGPRFSTKAYLRRYPDVALEKINPLFHYIQFGAAERREISPSSMPWISIYASECLGLVGSPISATKQRPCGCVPAQS